MGLTRINNQALTDVTSAGLPTLDSDKLPSGSVLQVKEDSYSGTISTTSTDFVDTGLSVDVTPTASGNKIIAYTCHEFRGDDSSGDKFIYTSIKAGTTEICDGAFAIRGTSNNYSTVPSTEMGTFTTTSTSQLTVKVQHKVNSSGGTNRWNDGGTATLVVMEVAG